MYLFFLKFLHKKYPHRSILSIQFYLITPIDLSLFIIDFNFPKTSPIGASIGEY